MKRIVSIALVVIAVIVIAVGGYYFLKKSRTNQYQTTQSLQKTLPENTSANGSWLTYSYSYPTLSKGLTLKYPSDWVVTKSGVHSGHPNLAIFYNSDHSQCVELSFSQNPTGTLDQEFAEVFDGDSQQGNKSLSSKSLSVNGYPAQIRSVTFQGKNLLDAAVDFGKSSMAGMNFYSDLSSCGMTEQGTFMKMLQSIKPLQK